MSSDVAPSAPSDARGSPAPDLGPLPRFARPFVDWVARLPATVHTKLLAGSC